MYNYPNYPIQPFQFFSIHVLGHYSTRRILVYAFEEPFEIIRVDARRNTVSEIRDPPFRWTAAFTERGTHATHAALNSFVSTVECCRVKIPLQRLVRRHCTRVLRCDAPVETEDVVARVRGGCEGGRRVGTLGEKDERDRREIVLCEACADGNGDVAEWRERELCEIVRSQLSRPRVENLEELRAPQTSVRCMCGCEMKI